MVMLLAGAKGRLVLEVLLVGNVVTYANEPMDSEPIDSGAGYER